MKKLSKLLILIICGLLISSCAITDNLKKTLEKNVKDAIETEDTEDNQQDNTTENEDNTVEKAFISGSLTYPSEFIPAMKVCAVNTTSQQETCVQTQMDQNYYEIEVDPGTYYVYADSGNNYVAYYTKCDTYDDAFIPECNSNAGNSNDDWYAQGYICYQDETCKNAFKPLAIVVVDENVMLKPIMQGWYVPCSYDTNTCNDSNFNVWEDFID